MLKRAGFLFCFSLGLLPPALWSQILQNPQAILPRLKLARYLSPDAAKPTLPAGLANLRVAIFDNGFTGFKAGSKHLPPRTRLIDPTGNAPLNEPHGFVMAQVMWAAMGGHYASNLNDGPELFLLHTNGLNNLEQAVDFVIANKVDIVVQSKVFDWGSNFDGRGLINAQINRAIDAGIIFINAAGNLHNAVYYQKGIATTRQSSGVNRVNLPGPGNTLNFSILKKNRVDISLAWSDFGEDKTFASNKDLDLYLHRKTKVPQTGKTKFVPVAHSEKSQIGRLRPTDNPNSLINALALERIVLDLDAGDYALTIVNRDSQFTTEDSFKVIIDAQISAALKFKHAQGSHEIGAPADNPRVLAVGALGEVSSRGRTADGRLKPDVLFQNTSVEVSAGLKSSQTLSTQGSSTAAAMFGGTVVLMKANFPQLSAHHLRLYLQVLKQQHKSDGGVPLWGTPRREWLQKFMR